MSAFGKMGSDAGRLTWAQISRDLMAESGLAALRNRNAEADIRDCVVSRQELDRKADVCKT